MLEPEETVMAFEALEATRRPIPPDGVSEADYMAAVIKTHEAASARQRQLLGLQLQRDQFRRQMRADIIAHVGADGWDKYRKYLAERRSTNHGLGAVDLNRQAGEKLDAARSETRAATQRILQQAGATITDLNRIRDTWQKQIDAAQPKTDGNFSAEILDDKDVPDLIKNAQENNTPFTKKPPYDPVSAPKPSLSQVGGDAPQIQFFHNPRLGHMGHHLVCENFNAGDADQFDIELPDLLTFWKDIKKPGTWTVFIKAVCIHASDRYVLFDEYGWSDSSSSMTCDISLWATADPFGDTWITRNLWHSRANGTPWSQVSYPHVWHKPGSERWIRIKIFGQIRPSSYQFSIGMESRLISGLNDVSAQLTMRNEWRIEHVTIDVD
jgi:hypothetical protein